jgi:LPXTG-site transpeptidase (sortase) family protein
MSVELINPNRTDLVGIGFTDTMPVGMFLANPPNLNTGTCGGALSATPGNNTFTFSGGFLPASTSCTLTLSVTMNVNGNLTNVIPASTVTTTNGATNPDPAEASLTNLAGASVSKFFSPNPIAAGEYSLLTITIVNTANVPLSGIGLLDTLPGLLPVGIAIAGPPAPAPVNNCGGTLAAATGSQDIQLSDGTLAASSSCTIVVAVTGSVPGDYQNIIPIGALTTNEGATNTQPAIDTLTITGSTELAALGDYVWNDLDADGIQDAGEAGIAGVTVRLLDENGNELATTTTDANGFYSFTDLTPGTYRVDFVPPAGYAISPVNQGGDDAVDSDADPTTGETANVTLVAGEINNTLDAGLYQPAALGNFVWLDADFDGIQDAGEIGIPNVTVRLLDANGNELATTTTDANGLYSFTDLAPGTYRVDFVPPAGYAISPQDQGANDAVDSDANALTGETANVTLAAGETNITLDAGLFLQAPDIQVTKTIPVVNFLNPGVFEITYSINVLNTGNVPLSNIQVTDDLTSTFPSPASFSIISLLSGTFDVNTDYDGDTDIDLLIGSDTLDPGASGVITLVVQVDTGGEESSYLNIVDVFGLSPSEQEVTDFDSISGPSFIDPALTKAVDPALAAVGDLVTFTITVFNNGNVAATGVVVTDPLPDNLDYVSATSIDAATLSPRGTITLIPPRTVQVDIGTVDVNDVLLITILTQVNSRGQPPIENQATLVADAPPQDISPDPLQNNTAVVSLNIRDDDDDDDGGGGQNRPRVGGGLIPVTGFAPGRITDLSGLPVTTYNTMNDVILEVPALKLEMPIVGIPKKGNTWDVNWLLNQAGWLEGSAFPGFSGNSVLTSHVTLPYGQAGPFADLHKLRLGDKVFVRAFGNLYIYEVKSIRELFATNPSILQHEENSWLTLVTCADYNEKAKTYLKRLVVRAVLIQAQPERWWSTWP